LIIWAMVLLLALDNLGIQIKPLHAALGIGGIAIALPSRPSSATSSRHVHSRDNPSASAIATIGDFQRDRGAHRRQEHRLRSLSGEQIIIANADDHQSAACAIFGAMGDRRRRLPVRRELRTPNDVLAAIPPRCADSRSSARHRFDRCHFLTYGDTALQFELVYFMTRPDFGVYAILSQAIHLALLDRLRGNESPTGSPTRALVYVELPAGPPTGRGADGFGYAGASRELPCRSACTHQLLDVIEALTLQVLRDTGVDFLCRPWDRRRVRCRSQRRTRLR